MGEKRTKGLRPLGTPRGFYIIASLCGSAASSAEVPAAYSVTPPAAVVDLCRRAKITHPVGRDDPSAPPITNVGAIHESPAGGRRPPLRWAWPNFTTIRCKILFCPYTAFRKMRPLPMKNSAVHRGCGVLRLPKNPRLRVEKQSSGGVCRGRRPPTLLNQCIF